MPAKLNGKDARRLRRPDRRQARQRLRHHPRRRRASSRPTANTSACIATGDRTSNCEFGEDGSTLFITADHNCAARPHRNERHRLLIQEWSKVTRRRSTMTPPPRLPPCHPTASAMQALLLTDTATRARRPRRARHRPARRARPRRRLRHLRQRRPRLRRLQRPAHPADRHGPRSGRRRRGSRRERRSRAASATASRSIPPSPAASATPAAAAQVNLCPNRRVLGVSCADYRQHGAFAEFVAVPQHILYPLPPDMPFEHAALIEPVSIALHAVARLQRPAGRARRRRRQRHDRPLGDSSPAHRRLQRRHRRRHRRRHAWNSPKNSAQQRRSTADHRDAAGRGARTDWPATAPTSPSKSSATPPPSPRRSTASAAADASASSAISPPKCRSRCKPSSPASSRSSAAAHRAGEYPRASSSWPAAQIDVDAADHRRRPARRRPRTGSNASTPRTGS